VNLFQLNAPFVNWAYQFSHAGVTLPDTSNLQTLRALYKTFAATQSPPQVLKGDVLAAGTFWIGELMNKWAENWVTYWSNGKAAFTITSEEDAGYARRLPFSPRSTRSTSTACLCCVRQAISPYHIQVRPRRSSWPLIRVERAIPRSSRACRMST
jgi:Purine nucleoside permease (NUP)